jgi:hypothetical protein
MISSSPSLSSLTQKEDCTYPSHELELHVPSSAMEYKLPSEGDDELVIISNSTINYDGGCNLLNGNISTIVAPGIPPLSSPSPTRSANVTKGSFVFVISNPYVIFSMFAMAYL